MTSTPKSVDIWAYIAPGLMLHGAGEEGLPDGAFRWPSPPGPGRARDPDREPGSRANPGPLSGI